MNRVDLNHMIYRLGLRSGRDASLVLEPLLDVGCFPFGVFKAMRS